MSLSVVSSTLIAPPSHRSLHFGTSPRQNYPSRSHPLVLQPRSTRFPFQLSKRLNSFNMKNDSKHSETTFHPFPQLPIELRCLIWRLSMLQPRLIHIMNVCDNNKTSLPSAANRESRAEFLSMYTKLFPEPPKSKPHISFVDATSLFDGLSSGKQYHATQQYANLSQDALFLDCDEVMRAKKKSCRSWIKSLTPQAIQNLKHLIFYIGGAPVFTHPDYSSFVQCLKATFEDLEQQLQRFTSLETLFIRVTPWDKEFEEHLNGMEILKSRPTVNVEFMDDSLAHEWNC